MGKLVVIIFLFFYIYPIYPSFLPFSTDRIIQIGGFFLLLLLPKKGLKIFLNKKVLITIFFSLVLSFIALLAQLRAIGNDFYLVKYFLDGILLLFSSYWIIFFAKIYIKDFNIISLLDYILIVTLIQAVISFYFFIYPSSYEYYIALLKQDANLGLISNLGIINKRLLGVGNAFFTGVLNYGVSFLILTIVPYLKESSFYHNKLMYWMSFIIIIAAGLTTGRTFIIAIGLSALLIIILERKKITRLFRKFIRFSLLVGLLMIIVSTIMTKIFDPVRLVAIYSYVFELFINFLENGQFETSSTNVLLDMYHLPQSFSTWVLGDGRFGNSDGSYYMGTDVGYIRLIYYFGLIATIFFVISQFYYFKFVVHLWQNKYFKSFLFILFLWVLILNLKGLANATPYFVLLLVCLVIDQKKHSIE